MRSILTIAKKDFETLVLSPLFMILATLCTSLWSFNYLRSLFTFVAKIGAPASPFGGGAGGQNIYRSVFFEHIGGINLLLIFIVPAITMRLLAEEKKMRTFDLLLTSPITSTDIAVGKFLAGWGAGSVLVLLSFLYPMGTGVFAEFQWGTLITAYAGVVMLTALYVGVGLFASSLTESVMLAVVMGLIFNLLLWFVSQAGSLSDAPMYQAVMEQMSLGQNFVSFLKGTIRISSVAFFVTATALFVFLTQRMVETARWR